MNTSDTKQGSVETDPHRWIAALRNSQDRLASLVGPLTAEELRGPSYHDWTIAQVLGHMGSQAEIFTAWVANALEGTEPAGREYMQPIWDSWDARSPDDQVADSLEINERLVQRFERLTDAELERMHLNLFGMELDGAGLPRLRVAEHTLHAWDIEVALDPAAQVAPDAVDLLIDTLPALAGRVGKAREQTRRLRVRTSDPERDFALQLGDAVTLTEWEDGSTDGELLIPAESFLRLIYGRLDQNHTPTLELTGPVPLDELREVFPGV